MRDVLGAAGAGEQADLDLAGRAASGLSRRCADGRQRQSAAAHGGAAGVQTYGLAAGLERR
jgi:hypothetical protein